MHVSDYLVKGHSDVSDVIREQHAVTRSELTARISDRPWKDRPPSIDPHHLTTVVQAKLARGDLEEDIAQTRGGRTVTVLTPSNRSGLSTAIDRAAARKRLLMARFEGWATGSVRHPRGLIGTAGEHALHTTLIGLAASAGYQLVRPESSAGDIGSLFGHDVPGGPLDDVAHLTLTSQAGLPRGHVTLLVEVKNVRQWIYRDHGGMHQLLFKAASLQKLFPDHAFLPVLVCRRAQNRTFLMSKALGFYVVQAKTQFLLETEETTIRLVNEVRSGLGFRDLNYVTNERWKALLKAHFRKSIPGVAFEASKVWREVGSQILDTYEVLRHPSTEAIRLDAMRDIYDAIGIGSDEEEDEKML